MPVTAFNSRPRESFRALALSTLLLLFFLPAARADGAGPGAGSNSLSPAPAGLCAELVRQLESNPRPEERLQAIRRMIEEVPIDECGGWAPRCPVAPPSLVHAARRDSSEEVRREALAALFPFGPLDDASVDTLIAILTLDVSEQVRERAQRALTWPAMRSPAAANRLHTALSRTTDPGQRWQLVLTLERSGGGIPEVAMGMAAAIFSDSVQSPAWTEAMLILVKAGADSLWRTRARAELRRTLRESPDVQRRLSLLRALARTPEPWPEIEPDLWRLATEESDPELRSATVECLGRYPWTGDVSRVVEFARAGQPAELRRRALHFVAWHAGVGDTLAWRVLVELTGDTDPSIAHSAIWEVLRREPGHPLASGRAGENLIRRVTSDTLAIVWRDYGDLPVGPEAVRVVLPTLASSRDVRTRAKLAGILGRWAEATSRVREAAPLLLRLTGSCEDSWVRREAVSALGALVADSARVVPRLYELSRHDPDASVRSAASGALQRIHAMHPRTARALLEVLAEDSDERVRFAAAWGLSEVGTGASDEFATLARAALTDPSRRVRSAAVRALPSYRVQADSGLAVLETLLAEGDEQLQFDACEAICRMPAPHRERARLLSELLRGHSDSRIREAAAVGLAKEGAPALPALRQALENDPDADVRDEAAYAYIEARLPPGEATRGLMENLDFNRGIGSAGRTPVPNLGRVVHCLLQRCESRLDHLSEDPDRTAMWLLTSGSRSLGLGEDPCVRLDEYCTWKLE